LLGFELGAVLFQGYDTNASTGAKLYAVAAANWGDSATDDPTDVYIATCPNASGTLVDVAMFASTGYMHTASSLMVGSLTVAPQSLLHVYAGASTTTPKAGTLVTIDDDAAEMYASFLGGNGTQGILFGCAADNDAGYIKYEQPCTHQLDAGFTIGAEGSLYLTMMKTSGDVRYTAFNQDLQDIDVIFYGDTAEIARFDAELDLFRIADDKKITFGSGDDGYIEYDENGDDVHIVVLKLPVGAAPATSKQLYVDNCGYVRQVA
jgi:hypothetical protein